MLPALELLAGLLHPGEEHASIDLVDDDSNRLIDFS
jgi:hypothetical protein